MNPELERREDSAMGSWAEAVAEVEEVLLATEAFCAARNKESSRVRRFTYDYQFPPVDILLNKLTTASCSFSSSICNSEAVRGRGCRNGPGPDSVAASLGADEGGWACAG